MPDALRPGPGKQGPQLPLPSGYAAPQDAPPLRRLWSSLAVGLIHLGWWYGMTPWHPMTTAPHFEEGDPPS